MRLSTSVYAAFLSTACAYPGMAGLMSELLQTPSKAMPLPGDLAKGATTDVGKTIKDCLEGKQGCESDEKKVCHTTRTLLKASAD